MKLDMTYLLGTAACLVALACGHEASAPTSLVLPIPHATAASTSAVTPAPPTTGVPAGPGLPAEGAAATVEADPTVRCIEVDDELGGKHVTLEGLVFVDPAHEHPTRGKTRPYILRLDAPRCAKGVDAPRVTEVHLASSEALALKPLVGKRVRISGDPFAAHTAWHARPIVLMATAVATLP